MDKEFMVFDGARKFDPDGFITRVKNCGLNKKTAMPVMAENLQKMEALQDKLYAESKEGVLILFQAMDAAGKDGTIKHVMGGVNPQGTQVYSFKQPSKEELNHDYLWRCMKCLPERGHIGIFNRSYYEDVLIAKVHQLPQKQNLPARCVTEDIWKDRYRQIRDFEQYLVENGITVLKFFLHVSKEEQKKRFLERIDTEEKNWKFSSADIEERQHWYDYQKAYRDAVNETSTKYAPWHVIPADAKWFARLAVSEFIVEALERLDPQYPKLSEEGRARLAECRARLLEE